MKYCPVCECVYEDSYAACIAKETSTTTPLFLARTHKLLNSVSIPTPSPKFEPVLDCSLIFVQIPERIYELDGTPHRYKKTLPECPLKYQTAAYFEKIYGKANNTPTTEPTPTLLSEDCSDAPECPKTRHESL